MSVPSIRLVLTEVNRVRAARGLDPLDAMPKGEVGNPFRCPLRTALQVHAVVPGFPGHKGYYRYAADGGERPLSAVLSAFGQAFDRDRYPELVA